MSRLSGIGRIVHFVSNLLDGIANFVGGFFNAGFLFAGTQDQACGENGRKEKAGSDFGIQSHGFGSFGSKPKNGSRHV